MPAKPKVKLSPLPVLFITPKVSWYSPPRSAWSKRMTVGYAPTDGARAGVLATAAVPGPTMAAVTQRVGTQKMAPTNCASRLMLIGARLAERCPPYNVKIDEKSDHFAEEGGLTAPLFLVTCYQPAVK